MPCAKMFYNWLGGQTFFSPVTQAQSSGYQWDPAAPLGLDINWERNDANDRLIEVRTYTLSGDILHNKGNNSPSGSLSRIENIDKQIDLITNAVSKDRQEFLVFDENNYIVIDEFPIVESLSFEGDNTWANHVPYELVFRVEDPVDAGVSGVKSASESWSFSQSEDETVEITHTAEAAGLSTTGKSAFTNAKDFVLSQTGQNPLIQSFFISMAGKSAFNHTKSESINRDDGTYSITEQWLSHDQNFLDDRQETITEERDSAGVLVAASGISGTVTGFSASDDPDPTERFNAAASGFNGTVKGQIGWTTASSIATRQQVNNLLAGTVQYNIDFSPTGGNNELENRSRTVTLDRNDDGTTVETVSASAQVRSSSTLSVQTAIDFVEANVFAENSTNPPFTASNSFITSRGREKNDIEKSASMTVQYLDVGGANHQEDYNVDITTDEGVVTGRITGSIQGLGEEPTVTSVERFSRAVAAWDPTIKGLRFSRVQSAANEIILNSSIVNDAFGEARNLGTVNYSATFGDKDTLPNGVIDEPTAQIRYNGGDAIFALIPIPGRSSGPIAQDMATIDPVTATVDVTRVFASGVSNTERIESVFDRAKDLFGGIFPKQHKQVVSHQEKPRSTSINVIATLTGIELDLTWRGPNV